MKKDTGIYKILNVVNNKYYIGSASSISRRWREHRRFLKLNRHTNNKLQNSYNKYGDVFIYQVLIYCSEKDLEFYEQRFLDKMCNKENSFNIATDVLRPALNITRSDEFKENQSNLMKERHKNSERRMISTKSIMILNQDIEFVKRKTERGRKRMIEYNTNPENKIKHSNILKELRQDEEFNKKMFAGLKEFNDNPEVKENARRNMREIQKKAFENQEFLETHKKRSKEHMIKLNSDPAFKAAQRERTRLRNLDPEFQRKCKETQKRKRLERELLKSKEIN